LIDPEGKKQPELQLPSHVPFKEVPLSKIDFQPAAVPKPKVATPKKVGHVAKGAGKSAMAAQVNAFLKNNPALIVSAGQYYQGFYMPDEKTFKNQIAALTNASNTCYKNIKMLNKAIDENQSRLKLIKQFHSQSPQMNQQTRNLIEKEMRDIKARIRLMNKLRYKNIALGHNSSAKIENMLLGFKSKESLKRRGQPVTSTALTASLGRDIADLKDTANGLPLTINGSFGIGASRDQYNDYVATQQKLKPAGNNDLLWIIVGGLVLIGTRGRVKMGWPL
jgi:hypothetical protein